MTGRSRHRRAAGAPRAGRSGSLLQLLRGALERMSVLLRQVLGGRPQPPPSQPPAEEGQAAQRPAQLPAGDSRGGQAPAALFPQAAEPSVQDGAVGRPEGEGPADAEESFGPAGDASPAEPPAAQAASSWPRPIGSENAQRREDEPLVLARRTYQLQLKSWQQLQRMERTLEQLRCDTEKALQQVTPGVVGP